MVKLISRYWQQIFAKAQEDFSFSKVWYKDGFASSPPPSAPPPDVPRAPPPPPPPPRRPPRAPPPPVVQKNCVLLADRVSITVATPLVRHCKRPREVCTHRNMIKGSKRLLDKAQNPPSGLESQQGRQLWFAWVQAICIIREALETEFWKYLVFCPNKGGVGLPTKRFYHFFWNSICLWTVHECDENLKKKIA